MDGNGLLINDFVVLEQYCNMNCTYCLTETSTLDKPQNTDLPAERFQYRPGNPLQIRMDCVTNSLRNYFGISILKLSGGEILMIRNLIDFIKQQAPKHDVVQLLTNAVLLDEPFLKQLKEIPNICLQISLDHHTLSGNEYRTPNNHLLTQILDHLEIAVNAGIPIEINCVLHNKNTHRLLSFAEYLMRFEGRAVLFPYPIRGSQSPYFRVSKDQLCGVEALLDNYAKLQKTLPPKVYLQSLVDFMKTGQRSVPCRLPQIAIGSFDDGRITPCANYWFKNLGNILTDPPLRVLDSVCSDRFYTVLSKHGEALETCRKCFTPWEILNLYFEGLLSLAEVCALPLYSFHGIRERLAVFRESLGTNCN